VSPRETQLWLADILAAIDEITRFTEGMTKAEFCENLPIIRAVTMGFIMIGEAAANIPAQVQDNYPDVPWQEMKRMRNKVAHAYFGVKLNVMWATIQDDLPPLVPRLRSILDNPEP
jgi:uncharacterized protein with HEPN domain